MNASEFSDAPLPDAAVSEPVEGHVGAPPLIREWHTMPVRERDAQWSSLVAWVIWIHDLYELAKEERLPLCWPRHPGLVEELRALKAWRDGIYDSPEAASTPHAARSWHGELRQTISAATTFWAPTCRAGHTDAPPLSAAHPDLAQQWQAAGPPLLTSAPQPTPVQRRVIPHGEMLSLLTAGHARPHSRSMPNYAKYEGFWWTRTSDGATWERCLDDAHHVRLEDTSARLRAADTAHDQLDRKEQPPCQT